MKAKTMNDNTMIWNCPGADNAVQAMLNARNGLCKASPACVTRSRAFGHQIDARRRWEGVKAMIGVACFGPSLNIPELERIAGECFTFSKRRGYGVLTLKLKA